MPVKKIAYTKKKQRPRKKRRPAQAHDLHRYASPLYMLIIGCLIVFIVFIISYVPKPDTRITRLNTYFAKYDMPLEGHGSTFVQTADTCGMDWRLLPAIAVRESSGGKHMQRNNPFGWGSAEIPFTDIDDAIRGVGYNLCGFNTNTAKWYGTTSTEKKLYYYNGTVLPTYPDEVMWIMDQF